MSVKLTNWVWHDPRTEHLRGNAAMALLALADIADDEGHVVFARGRSRSQEALAKKARMSVATFRRVTEQLAAEGLLEMSRPTQTSEKEYRILATAQTERSDLSGQTVDNERSHRSPVSGRSSLIRIDVSDVITSDVASDSDDAEIVRLCDLLADAVRANGHRVENVGKRWRQSCERLIRLDGYSVEQIEWMIRWATADEFWAANIRSMPTLREKFSTLVLQAKRQAGKRQAQSPNERASSVVEMGRRLQEAGVA